MLGWNRGADVASEFIPEIYFDFLRGGAPDPLVPIFLHNQMDLRGLAALSSRIVALLSETEREGKNGFELFGLSRICERRGEAKRARKHYEQALAADELPPETDRIARRSLARMAKREGDFSRARDLWEGMLGSSQEGFEAYEQLAIYYERCREPQRAAFISRDALTELQRAKRLGTIGRGACQKLRERFEHRLARLERKAGRLPLEPLLAESSAPAGESDRKGKERTSRARIG